MIDRTADVEDERIDRLAAFIDNGKYTGSLCGTILRVYINGNFYIRYFGLSRKFIFLVLLFKIGTDGPAFLGSVVLVKNAYVVVYKYTAAASRLKAVLSDKVPIPLGRT